MLQLGVIIICLLFSPSAWFLVAGVFSARVKAGLVTITNVHLRQKYNFEQIVKKNSILFLETFKNMNMKPKMIL